MSEGCKRVMNNLGLDVGCGKQKKKKKARQREQMLLSSQFWWLLQDEWSVSGSVISVQ